MRHITIILLLLHWDFKVKQISPLCHFYLLTIVVQPHGFPLQQGTDAVSKISAASLASAVLS